MDVTPWTIYWITRLDGIIFIATLCCVALFASVLIKLIYYLFDLDDCGMGMSRGEVHSTYKPVIARRAAWLLLASFATSAIPTTKQMAAILVIPAVVNNEDVQEVGGEFVDLAREWMRELRPEGGQ